MALSAEIQVKKDLGVPTRKRKATNFSKLFVMPPHITYTARDLKTAQRLRRLMNTNIISLTDWRCMERLEARTVDIHVEDLKERMDERAREAAAAAHLRLWEEVLRGQCSLPLEHLEDPCMQDIRRQQLKLQALQKKADKLGTTFQRVLAQPKEWSPPTNWDKLKKVEKARARRRSSAAERRSHAAADRKSVDTTEQYTIVSLGEFFNKLSCGSQVGESIARTSIRRKRAKSMEPEATEWQQARETATGSTRVSVRPSSPQPQTPGQRTPRSARRVMPEKRKPVVYPPEPPSCLLLSAKGGKHVLGPPTNPDYIIPKYFVPKALDHLRTCKTLEELFTVGDELFETRYPDDDNRRWADIPEHLKEARDRMEESSPPNHEVQN